MVDSAPTTAPATSSTATAAPVTATAVPATSAPAAIMTTSATTRHTDRGASAPPEGTRAAPSREFFYGLLGGRQYPYPYGNSYEYGAPSGTYSMSLGSRLRPEVYTESESRGATSRGAVSRSAAADEEGDAGARTEEEEEELGSAEPGVTTRGYPYPPPYAYPPMPAMVYPPAPAPKREISCPCCHIQW